MKEEGEGTKARMYARKVARNYAMVDVRKVARNETRTYK